jgi:hypothetical protein
MEKLYEEFLIRTKMVATDFIVLPPVILFRIVRCYFFCLFLLNINVKKERSLKG